MVQNINVYLVGWKGLNGDKDGIRLEIFPVALPPHKHKKEMTFSFSTPRMHIEGCRGVAPLILNLSISWEWLTSCPGRITAGKELRFPLSRNMDGPHSLPERFAEEKKLLPLPGFELWTIQTVAVLAVPTAAVRTTKLWRCACSKRGILKVWAVCHV
jgi:hypothetical protein